MVLRDAQPVGVLETEPLLSDGATLLGRLAIPVRRSRIVRRDDYRKQVPKRGLSGAITLVGKRTEESHRGVIVPARCSSRSILKWPSGHRASKADGKHESGDGCLEGAFHPRCPLSAL